MLKPRYTQVSLEATPYYHCVSRCVRRAFDKHLARYAVLYPHSTHNHARSK